MAARSLASLAACFSAARIAVAATCGWTQGGTTTIVLRRPVHYTDTRPARDQRIRAQDTNYVVGYLP